jgi:NAD dependent epimerase/dehydratase family enzyme
MKVAITGASGLVGRALVRSLRDDGHAVVRLVRKEPGAADEARWDPFGAIEAKALAGLSRTSGRSVTAVSPAPAT